MFKNRFIDCSVASFPVHAGDAIYNAKEIVSMLNNISKQETSIVCFPELALTGVSLFDGFYQNDIIFDAMDGLKYILDNNQYEGIAIFGGILAYDDFLFNVAFVIQKDIILGIVPKNKLDTREKEYFNTFKSEHIENPMEIDLFDFTVPFGNVIFNNNDSLTFGVTIGNERPTKAFKNGAKIVFNLNAIVSCVGSFKNAKVQAQSDALRGKGGYLVTSIGASDSSSEVIYSGLKLAFQGAKKLLASENYLFNQELKTVRFDLSEIEYQKKLSGISKKTELPYVEMVFEEEEDELNIPYCIDKLPFVPKKEKELETIIDLQAASMAKRLNYVGCKKVVLGVSGGLDSTVALLSLCHLADQYGLDRKNIIGVRLPTENNSSTTYQNSCVLMEKLGIDAREIKIEDGAINNLKQIGHDLVTKDVTYENAQARYRTMTLMNLANKEGALVCGTGDMSELALGWCTFNGDHMAMYGLNAGLPKTTIKAVTAYYKKIYPEVSICLDSILETPISPELAGSNQKTEDIIGKYEINDFILYRRLVSGDEEARIESLLVSDFKLDEEDAHQYVTNFMKRFHSQAYKRLTMPEGVKVFDLSLSPRSGLKMSGDTYYRIK